ncbi:putative pectin methylesterase [Aspergillus alliaceus]|uniref:putative pectin methylesterase n=1 Tax=Petromyces alliaceus TaxID=209559 RepID=UPI0012A5F220|nr:putative pectinesterase A [Aspergillus alliaceus]KAB8239061.1 putative pectinesterase A [Aspergillus alliaceus]
MYGAGLIVALLGLTLRSSASVVRRVSSRTNAPSRCLTVGKSGSYSTVGDALSALGSLTADACIYIAAGIYEEQLSIEYGGHLTLYGETSSTDTYKENTVTITHTISSPEAGSLDKSATINVKSELFSMYNINVVNGYGSGAQAVALVANADRLGFYACKFTGYQDTLYAKAGHQYYTKSRIEGAVDYIFGDASAWFEDCDIVSNGPGAITASSRETTSDTAWYAIDHCNIKAASGVELTDDIYLGRPWRALARVIYQHSVLSDIVNPKGWKPMAEGATPLYYEFNNTGDGSDTSKREYLSSIGAAVTKETVLGDDYKAWVDLSV